MLPELRRIVEERDWLEICRTVLCYNRAYRGYIISHGGSRVQGLSCQFMLMVVQRNLSQGRTCGGSTQTSETTHVGGYVSPMEDCF